MGAGYQAQSLCLGGNCYPDFHPVPQLQSCFGFVSARLVGYAAMLLELSKLFMFVGLVFVFETGSCVAQTGPELLILHLPGAGIITVFKVCSED